jgi:hypothetical protein
MNGSPMARLMKTSSFFLFQGPGRISIACYPPKGIVAGFKTYKALAPAADMLKMSRDQYVPRYAAILGRLSPQQVWDDLHALAGDDEPVLLCWEKPPFSEARFCHRRLVAEWFAEKLGQEIQEMNF